MNRYDQVLIINFGSQNNLLIPRKVRDLGVFCMVKNYKITKEEILKINPKALILTGEPTTSIDVIKKNFNMEILSLNIPILALGFPSYLIQMDDKSFKGTIEKESENLPFLKNILHLDVSHHDIPHHDVSHHDEILNGIAKLDVLKNNVYKIIETSNQYDEILREKSEVIISKHKKNTVYALNFIQVDGFKNESIYILKNFLFNIAHCEASWNMKEYAKHTIKSLKDKIKDKKVLLALSGGVDSSVMAALLSKAVGNNLTCIFVDHGLMRKNEGDEVYNVFSNLDLNFIRVDAEKRFMDKLKNITDPEEKRKIIGEEFIRVFEKEGKKVGSVDFLAQGTIYPDIIESGDDDTELIKSHHNVGGLPDYVDFKEIIEPLDLLFKDEVRELGRVLGLSDQIVDRQPFPGPGLAIRVIGDITKEKLDILRDADYIFREEIEKSSIKNLASQYFAVLTSLKSVGIKDGKRTYDYTLALRCVTTIDFMTATFTKIPYDILEKVSDRIINEVNGINRIVYDITSKPPASIEWE